MRLKLLFRALRIAAVWTVILLMSFDTALACKLFFMKLPVCHSTYVSAPLRSCYPVDCCPAPTSYCELGSAWNYADHGVVISPPADCGTHQTVVEASPPEEVDCAPVEEGSTTSITEPEGVEHAPEAPIPELTQDEPSHVGLVVPDAPDDVLDTAPEADVSGIDEENLADDPAVPNAVEPALLEEDLAADDALLGDVADDPADDLLDVKPVDEGDGLEDLFDEGAAPADEDDGLEDLFDEGTAPADEDDGLEDLFDEGAAPADEDDGLGDLFDEGAAPADEDADLFDDSDAGEEPVDDEEGDDLEDLFNQNLPAIETENLVEARPAPADANDNRVVEVSATSAASRDALPVRQWTDNTGLFSTVGRLIEVSPESVRLLKDNGRNTTVAWYRLSDADQEYVRHVAAIFDDTVAAQLAER